MTEQTTSYRGTHYLVIGAALVIIIAGIYQARSILALFLVAVFLAVIGTPPVLWLERKRIPSLIAVLIVVAPMITILLIISVFVGASLKGFSESLPFYQTRIQEHVSALKTLLTAKGIAGSGNIHGLRTSSGGFTAQTEQGVLQGFAAFVEYNGRVYQLLGYTSQPRWSNYESGLTQAIKSFDRLTDSRMLSVQPQHLKLVTINRNMSLTEFNRQYPSGASLEVLALINQVESNGQLRTGQQVKRVVGEKFE